MQLPPEEIEKLVRRCDRRRRWKILVFTAPIVALLIVGALPGFRVIERAKSASAHAAMAAIVIATEEFFKDYDRLPIPTGADQGQRREFDSSLAGGVITILKGLNENVNPRGVDFLGDIKEAKDQGGHRVDGQTRDQDHIGLVDPWGGTYVILLDTDNDGIILTPAAGNEPPRPVKARALVYSPGKDGNPATWNDNLVSWL